MTVSDITIQVDGLGSFIKNLERISAEAGKKLATNVQKIQAELWKLLQTMLQQLYLGAPFKNFDLEQRLERKLNDVNSIKNSNKNIKELIIHLKDKNNRSKNNKKNYKMLTTILKTIETIVIVIATSSSITLSLKGIYSIVISISTGVACGLSIGNKVIYEIFMQKFSKYKKYEKDQQNIEFFDKLNRKSSQNNISDKSDHEFLCKTFTKNLDESKNDSFFINMNLKIKLCLSVIIN